VAQQLLPKAAKHIASESRLRLARDVVGSTRHRRLAG
jgi:hypothetical protein